MKQIKIPYHSYYNVVYCAIVVFIHKYGWNEEQITFKDEQYQNIYM